MGVLSGFFAVVLIFCGPQVKSFEPHWRIRFLPIRQ
jgi:hypothetical protein